jgi:hypothetical protein
MYFEECDGIYSRPKFLLMGGEHISEVVTSIGYVQVLYTYKNIFIVYKYDNYYQKPFQKFVDTTEIYLILFFSCNGFFFPTYH